MKKLLLFALLWGGAATAGAADLEMRIDGKAVGTNYTAYVNEDNWLDDGEWRSFVLEIKPYLTSEGTANILLSAEAVEVETFDYDGDPTKPQITICTNFFPENDNCFLFPLKDLKLAVNNANNSYFHLTYTCPSDVALPEIVATYRLSWKGDATGSLLVTFDSKNASVEAVAADNAPKRYYNLLGHEVERPGKGLYIVCQGGKTSKVVIR